MDEREGGPAVRWPVADYDFGTADAYPTQLSCPICGGEIFHLIREDTGEHWYFHGNRPTSHTLVLSEVEARQAAQSTVKRNTVPGRVMKWSADLHGWDKNKALAAVLAEIQARGYR